MVDGVIEPGGAQPGLEQQDVANFVQQQSRNVYLKGAGFHLLQEGPRFCYKILVACFEPLDEDRGVNDDLRGRNGSRDSSG